MTRVGDGDVSFTDLESRGTCHPRSLRGTRLIEHRVFGLGVTLLLPCRLRSRREHRIIKGGSGGREGGWVGRRVT